MPAFPLPLLENETVLKMDEKAQYIKDALGVGYNILSGRLWLTNARLVHQDVLGRLTTYPISHITRVVRETVSVARKKFAIQGIYQSWDSWNAALLVTFDNTGSEYFIPQQIDEWAQAITQARPTAPALAYTHTPPLRPSLNAARASGQAQTNTVSNNSRRLFGIVFTIVAVFMCAVTTCVVIPFILAIIRAGN